MSMAFVVQAHYSVIKVVMKAWEVLGVSTPMLEGLLCGMNKMNPAHFLVDASYIVKCLIQ